MSLLSTLSRSAALGIGTGIRSTGPLALVAYAASKEMLDVPLIPPLALFTDKRVVALLATMAIGEAAADASLPLPARTSPGPLVGRMAIGALLGALVCADAGQPLAAGAGIGALSAAWASFAATGGRRLMADSGIPDIATSLLEDAQTLLLGATALRRVGSAVG